MAKFKPGDVVLYTGNLPGHRECIVKSVDSAGCVWGLWKNPGNDYVASRDTWRGQDDCLVHHPDPDRVWADFCKWRLTNASD